MTTDTRSISHPDDDHPVHRYTAAAGAVFRRTLELIVRRAAFWAAVVFPAVYLAGAVGEMAGGLPEGWFPVAIGVHLLVLWVGHDVHHPT